MYIIIGCARHSINDDIVELTLDIDKLYIMGYSIMDNGSLQTFSRLQEDFYIDLVKTLKKPDGRKFEVGDDGIVIDLDIINTPKDLMREINNVLNQPSNKIKFVFTKSKKELKYNAHQFLRYINKHSSTELTSFAKDAALKNIVVDGILNVTYDPENQINASVPINMDDQQEAKANSTLGKDELYVTADSPATKYMMQVQNMAGKEVIGITAVSLKTFFAASTYFNLRITELKKAIQNNDEDSILEILDSLIIQNKLKSSNSPDSITTIANLNYDMILDIIKNKTDLTIYLSDEQLKKYPDLAKAISLINSTNNVLIDNRVLELDLLIKHLAEISSRSDASLAISGLLSSATDSRHN